MISQKISEDIESLELKQITECDFEDINQASLY